MVIINGVEYEVGTASISRSIRRDYKYQVTTEDGILHKEVRATYVDFSLSLGNVNPEAYDGLMQTLLGAVDDITVTLPKGRSSIETYVGEFKSVSDSVLLENDDGTYWDNLTLSFAGTVPVEVGA